MLKRNWIEVILLTGLLGLIYFSPIFSSPLPVFYGEFNDVDGSLYAVRIFDLLLSTALVIFASRYLLPTHFDLRSLLKPGLILVLSLVVSSLAELGWDQLTLIVFNLPTAPGEVSDKMLAYPRRETLELSIVLGNSMALGAGLIYGLLLDRGNQIRRQERLERKRLEAEVKFLRSQINPHFLFNTLNNIFAITQRNDDEEGSNALLRLSGLMRYMLYESTESDIQLTQEISHIQDYRDLMLLKYAKTAQPEIIFKTPSIPESCLIAPLLLLPFVENAFKHGIDNSGQGYIHIDLKLDANELYFQILNSAFDQRTANTDHKGIGLDNVRQRLELLYPNRHELLIDDQAKTYKIRLKVKLS